MSKNKLSLSDLGGFVFSTDPNFRPPVEEEKPADPPNEKQPLRLWLERGKGGKMTTVVKGFSGSDDALEELARLLKNKCATGGNAKDGDILLQGDHREKVMKLLLEKGFKNVKKAGG